MRQIDTHGLRGNLIVPDRLERPAVAGIQQQHDQPDADARDQERNQRGQIDRHVALRVPDIEIIEVRIQAQHIGSVCQRTHVVPLNHHAHDLREAERGDRQIVALQPQNRETDQQREERRREPRHDQRHHNGHGELNKPAVIILIHDGPALHRDGEDRVNIGADHHEARLAEREDARKAVQQVHGYRHQRVGRAFFQHGKQHGGGRENLLRDKNQYVDGSHDAPGDHRRLFIFFCHFSHLTPCPSSFPRKDPWASRSE